jgi:hypothetical protein
MEAGARQATQDTYTAWSTNPYCRIHVSTVGAPGRGTPSYLSRSAMELISGITGTIVAPRSNPDREIDLGELDRFNLRCRQLFLSNLLFIGLILITA